MSYGNPNWQSWVLPAEEGVKHIKAAYDAGINTFDTANVSIRSCHELSISDLLPDIFQRVLGSYPGKSHQGVTASSRGDRGHDQGTHKSMEEEVQANLDITVNRSRRTRL